MQHVARAGVSSGMNRAAVVVAVAAIAGALWYLKQPSPASSSAAPADEVAPRPPASIAAEATRAQPIAKVTRLASADDRRQLADRIAAARSSHATPAASVHAPSAPSLPAEAVEANQAATLKVEIRSAMRDVIPLLTECYEAALPQLADDKTKIVAELTLTGDPDVGTLIDAKQLADDTGKPLPATFDDCLRSTFQSLALPPLAEGDTFEVHYPFVFAKN